MTVIGSAYVNIRAITDKLESDIRSSLESITDSISIHVDADVSSATAKLDELANNSLEDQTLTVDADTSDAQRDLDNLAETVLGDQIITVRADTDQAVQDINDIANLAHLRDQTVHVDVEPRVNPTQAIVDLHALANQSLRTTLDVEADVLGAQRQIDDMMDDIRSTRPNVTPNLSTLFAEARLAILTRARTIRVGVLMNSRPLLMAGNAIARMTGARVLTQDIGRLVKHFINIDQSVPRIAKLSVLLGGLGGAALSSIGGLLTLSSALGSIINMTAAVAPGMAVGFIVGIGTLITALKDFKNQLPEVVAQYKTLGATIKGNYWDVARNSIRDMTQTLFPQFQTGLTQTSRSLGAWSATLADALTLHLDNGVVVGMFDNLSKSIDVASRGLEPMVQALVELGYVGGEYLPKLAGWFADVSTKFGDFIAQASDNGDIHRWIDEGIYNLKRLGSLIGEVSGFLGGLTDAAKMAGSDGLGTMLSFFTRLNDAVNDPEGMQKMATIFEGANTVATSLGDAFFKIFGALGNASGAIKSAFESIGGSIDVVADAIAEIINNPEFQEGFVAMFDGIQKGFEALFPVIGSAGPKMGAFLSIIGSLAANIGGVLGAALEVTLPLITALKKAVDPLIPILGDALISIIEALAPVFDMLANTLTQLAPIVAIVVGVLADLVVGLVQGLGPALPGIVAVVASLAVGFFALGPATAAVTGVVAAVNGFKGIIQLVVGLHRNFGIMKFAVESAAAGFRILGVAMAANPIGIAIAAVAALVAGFILAYNNIGWFKDGVDAAMKWVGEAIGNLVSFWNTEVVPMWNNAMAAAGEFFGAIGSWVGDAIKNVQDFFGGFGKGADEASGAVGDFVGGIGDAVGGFFGGIGQGISDGFNGVVDFVSGILTTIGDFLKERVDNMVANWTAAFNIIRDVFVNIWNGLVAVFSPIINLIGTIIGAFIEIAVAIWTAGWEIVFLIFRGIWENLVRFFTPILDSISSFISDTITNIQTGWNIMWQAVSDYFTVIWSAIVAYFTPILQGISDFIANTITNIKTGWDLMWQSVSDYFTVIWSAIVAYFTPILQGISDFITNTVTNIQAVWNSMWQAISDYFTVIWSAIVAYYTPILQSISDFISSTISNIQSIWNSTWSAIGDFISQVWSNIVSAVTGFVNKVRDKVTEVLDKVGAIGSDIIDKVSNFPSLLVSAGTDLINGLINGITAGKDRVLAKIQEIASGAKQAIMDFFGIKSPSRVMRDEVGKQIGAGLAIGIEASIGAVLKATDKLAKAAVPDIADIMLPAIKTASGASQRASVVGTLSPALTRASVTGSSSTPNGTGVFGQQSNGGTTNVNFNVQTSPGLNEVQIGEAAMDQLYWKLSTTV